MYQILARKYRPQNLQELIGQDVLIKTISNAIIFERIPQAILLSGSYGIGKTTTARIIAKILNCENLITSNKYVESCNQCTSCLDISKSIHPDVVEIDAASNTGVDNIRSLIENAYYVPTYTKYKIFIIDEIHMLSNNAFNALLKTLEEPPKHLKFIFATTEASKVPITVVSRCQKFNLCKISQEKIAHYLYEIANKENIKIDKESLKIISELSDGSMRDGLSMLDQIVNYKEDIICPKDVNEFFGIPEKQNIKDIFDHLFKQDFVQAKAIIDQLYINGISAKNIFLEMINFIHQMLISSDNKALYNRSWNIVIDALKNVDLVNNPEIILDVTCMQILHATKLPQLSDLIKQISEKINTDVNNKSNLPIKNSTNSNLSNEIKKYFPNANIED